MAYRAFCPRCIVALGPVRHTRGVAEKEATTHSTVAGHHTQVVDIESGRVVVQVAGEPGLPLWDAFPPEL
jgi:hypothetical protein